MMLMQVHFQGLWFNPFCDCVRQSTGDRVAITGMLPSYTASNAELPAGTHQSIFEGGRRFWFLFVLKDAAKLNQLLDVVCSEDKGFCVSKANKTSRSSNALSV